MSKRPNRYKKKKKKKLHIREPLTLQETVQEQNVQDKKLHWGIKVALLMLVAVGLVFLLIIQPELGGFLTEAFRVFVREFPRAIYMIAGSLYINCTIFAILLFLMLDYLPLKYSGLKTLIPLFVFGLVIGLICKLIFYPEIFCAIILGGSVAVHILHVKSKREIFEKHSVIYYIKWFLVVGAFFAFMAGGLFFMLKEHPFKLQGEISAVNCYERRGYHRGSSYLYAQIVYDIVEPNHRRIDDTLYASQYDVPIFYYGFTNQASDHTRQYYMNMKGKNIWVRGSYEYIRGKVIPMREIYFDFYICFIALVHFVLCLVDIIRSKCKRLNA